MRDRNISLTGRLDFSLSEVCLDPLVLLALVLHLALRSLIAPRSGIHRWFIGKINRYIHARRSKQCEATWHENVSLNFDVNVARLIERQAQGSLRVRWISFRVFSRKTSEDTSGFFIDRIPKLQ